jgi:hypothetical protein
MSILDVQGLKMYYSTLKGDVKAVDGVISRLRRGRLLGGRIRLRKDDLAHAYTTPKSAFSLVSLVMIAPRIPLNPSASASPLS